VVIAKGKCAELEAEILRVYDGDDDDPCRWKLLDGEAKHMAIVETEPGSECCGDDKLAAALSRSTEAPAYVLWLNHDSPRVQAFERGKYAGEIVARPDDVASQLGCKIAGVKYDQAATVDLTPSKAPVAQPGELTIGLQTIAQWRYQMKFTEWSAMLDGASEATVREVIAALGHADAETRRVACKLAGALGVAGLGKNLIACCGRLRALAELDPDDHVRACAREVLVYLLEPR
jgi:hypothetical protein